MYLRTKIFEKLLASNRIIVTINFVPLDIAKVNSKKCCLGYSMMFP